MVIACPMALCGLSGATTITRPNAIISSAKVRIPGAKMPSSLVTRMRGSCFMGRKGTGRSDDHEDR